MANMYYVTCTHAWVENYVHCTYRFIILINYERKSEQAHIPYAPPLLENAVYNKWQFQALVRGNRTENQIHLSCTK